MATGSGGAAPPGALRPTTVLKDVSEVLQLAVNQGCTRFNGKHETRFDWTKRLKMTSFWNLPDAPAHGKYFTESDFELKFKSVWLPCFDLETLEHARFDFDVSESWWRKLCLACPLCGWGSATFVLCTARVVFDGQTVTGFVVRSSDAIEWRPKSIPRDLALILP